MARIKALKSSVSAAKHGDGAGNKDYPYGLPYLTDNVRTALQALPPFREVTTWTKELGGLLKEFSFMNLLIYLLYGRYKTFDMQPMKAYRSLKAYKYFYDGFVHNVWIDAFSNSTPPMAYVRAFVHHS